MKAFTVNEKLIDLFSMFGFPGYLHMTKGPVSCYLNLNHGFTVWVSLPTNRTDTILNKMNKLNV